MTLRYTPIIAACCLVLLSGCGTTSFFNSTRQPGEDAVIRGVDQTPEPGGLPNSGKSRLDGDDNQITQTKGSGEGQREIPRKFIPVDTKDPVNYARTLPDTKNRRATTPGRPGPSLDDGPNDCLTPDNVGAAKPSATFDPGVRRTAAKEPGNETPQDSHNRTNPTATGAILNLGPYDSGVERAVELAKQLSLAENENRILKERMRGLEQKLETREKMLREDEVELAKANEEVLLTRAELQRLRDELVKLKIKLRQVEREDLETLRSIVTALEKLLSSTKLP